MTESAPVKVSNLESVAVNQCQVRPVVSERAAVTVQTDGRRDEVGWFLLDFKTFVQVRKTEHCTTCDKYFTKKGIKIHKHKNKETMTLRMIVEWEFITADKDLD